jgi:hypothetical protein
MPVIALGGALKKPRKPEKLKKILDKRNSGDYSFVILKTG